MSFPVPHAEGNKKIDWVIAGGESGPGARPMHSDWARSLRDQCRLLKVPFFFKGWGEWLPYEETASQPLWRSQDGHEHDANCFMPDWGNVETEKHWDDGLWAIEERLPGAIFEKVGKKASGRMLDGVEYSQFRVRAVQLPSILKERERKSLEKSWRMLC